MIGLGLFKEHSWAGMLTDIQLLAINSVLAPIVTYGLIGIFEIIFEVTTDLTLIELLDYDHPLLKRLDQEADEDRFADLAQILLDQAFLAEGSALEDPASYVARLNKLLVEMSDD